METDGGGWTVSLYFHIFIYPKWFQCYAQRLLFNKIKQRLLF
jgi:hypothetical protein